MGQRLADQLARLNGSWTFILVLLALSVLWAVVNCVLPKAFDAYPFYNLVLAILTAIQGPLIVMSQNRQALKDRLNADTDFRVNLKNELGIEQLLRELAEHRAEMNARFRTFDRKVSWYCGRNIGLEAWARRTLRVTGARSSL